MVNELKNKFEEVKFIEEEKNSYQNVLLGVDELIFLANRLWREKIWRLIQSQRNDKSGTSICIKGNA